MKERMLKLMLVVVLLFCFQISDIMTVHANEPDPGKGNVEQEGRWKKDKPDKPKEDFPDLKGGPENPERVIPQPVDMTILQKRYPNTFILRGPTNQKRIALTFDDGPDP